MKKHYDLILVTNIPSFYKVRLWNEVAKYRSLYVFFMSPNEDDRVADFVSAFPTFEYSIVSPCNPVKKSLYICRALKVMDYDRLVIGGWESLPAMAALMHSPEKKNVLFCESSVYEYQKSYVKDTVKHIILSHVSLAVPSGLAQGKLLRKLGYKGELKYSGGCGLLNYQAQPEYQARLSVKEFLYVGRLSPEKNLEMLISAFASKPQLHLNIIGYGSLEAELKASAPHNVTFIGPVDNRSLSSYYREADVFILPSLREPWGLVVEEALNNGTPVIVSDMVGCREDLVTEKTGLVFRHDDKDALLSCIGAITDIDFYNSLRKNVSELDFMKRADEQVMVYSSL